MRKIKSQPGGSLFEWRPTGVEGGGGRTASFTKVWYGMVGEAKKKGKKNQGMDFELPWSARPSSSPVVLMTATSPQSCPGIQWQSLGNKLTTFLRQDNTMQPLPFRLHLLNVDLKKSIQNNKYYWQFWHSFVYILSVVKAFSTLTTASTCFRLSKHQQSTLHLMFNRSVPFLSFE